MKYPATILIFLFILAPMAASAESLSVGENLKLQFELPEGWEISELAPDFLIKDYAEHVLHELAEQGKEVEPQLVRQKVSERLSANEGYLYNPATGAHLIIDFSPLGAKDKSPSKRTVAASARLAGEQFKEETGIESVRYATEKTHIPGAEAAYRVEADYTQHDHAKRFTGVVGFTSPYWFFLYYTDPLRDSADSAGAKKIFSSLAIVPGS